jgi:hypothetical protein
MLAAYLATFDFVAGLETDKSTHVDFEHGKNISPWVMTKRLRSI